MHRGRDLAAPRVRDGAAGLRNTGLLADRIGPHAELAFARSIRAGELVVEPVIEHDWARIEELTEQHLDLPLGIVDASVIALAERHGVETIATLDHRHFGTVKPQHVEGFALLP